MKATVNFECTAEEARAFLGLPDVSAINEQLISEMQVRLSDNLNALQPEELLKSWMLFGGAAQEQFRKLMMAATSAATGGGRG